MCGPGLPARDAWEPPGRAATDALLVAAGRGDLDAFAAFYDATAPLVVGLFRRVPGRADRAERLTEAVYLALWRDAPAFDPGVRSADATLLHTARRALIGPVRQLLAPTDARGQAAEGRSAGSDAATARRKRRHRRVNGV